MQSIKALAETDPKEFVPDHFYHKISQGTLEDRYELRVIRGMVGALYRV